MKENIWSDMTIAIELASKASTPDRRLAGAEWLHQLAGQLVELIRQEQPQPEQTAPEEASPGEGWRMLEDGEIIQEGDEFFSRTLGMWLESMSFGKGAIAYPYRRRIAPETPAVEPDKVRYFHKSGTVWKAAHDGAALCRNQSCNDWIPAGSALDVLLLAKTPEITREEAIQITGEP